MWLVWLMLACSDGPESSHSVSDSPPTNDPPVVSGPPLQLVAPVGIRDLHAETSSDASVRWERLGDGAWVEGAVVPAAQVFPGDTWRAVATDALGSTEAEVTVPSPPGGNVLLLVIDDIGLDHIGVYGMGTDTPPTPRIDALAADGVRFQRAYASPNCSPTRGEVMSGRHASRTGLGWIVDTGDHMGALSVDAVSLPEALWDARGAGSYANAALGKWHIAGDRVDDYLTHPNRTGFDHFAGTWGNPLYREDWGYYRWNKNVNGEVTETDGYLTTNVVDDALEQIDLLPEPWLLYVGFHAAHTPLSVPPLELYSTPLPADATENELFNATIEALDSELGRLLDGIPSDVRGQTTVILLGDNGTPHHAVDPPLNPARAKGTPFEQGVRVPLVVSGPHVAPGIVQDSLVHAVDVFTLVAEIAGVPLSGPDTALSLGLDGTVLDGQSMLPLLSDPSVQGRDAVYAEGFSPNGPGPHTVDIRGLRDHRWSLVRDGDSEAFFDLGPSPTLEEGEDLLGEPMTPEAEEAWGRLSALLDAKEQELVFEGL